MISKKRSIKTKTFLKNSFSNKFYIIFHFLLLCEFVSIQNIGRSIPLKNNVYKSRPKRKEHYKFKKDKDDNAYARSKEKWPKKSVVIAGDSTKIGERKVR